MASWRAGIIRHEGRGLSGIDGENGGRSGGTIYFREKILLIPILAAQAQRPRVSEPGFESIAAIELGARTIELGYKFGKILVGFGVFREREPFSSGGDDLLSRLGIGECGGGGKRI